MLFECCFCFSRFVFAFVSLLRTFDEAMELAYFGGAEGLMFYVFLGFSRVFLFFLGFPRVFLGFLGFS